MPNMPTPPFLRRALLFDAVATGATAGLLLLGAGLLADLLGFPLSFLREAGLILVPFVILVVWAGLRRATSTPAIWAILALNILWVAASLVVLVVDWFNPTMLGYLFVAAQAFVVGVFAALQYLGLRRAALAA